MMQKVNWQKELARLDFDQARAEDQLETVGDNQANQKRWLQFIDLKNKLPADVKLKFYLDFDQRFIVLLPLVQRGKESSSLQEEMAKDPKQEFDIYFLSEILLYELSKLGLSRMKRNPQLHVVHIRYVSHLTDFMAQTLPFLALLGQVFYTKSFETLLVRKSLQLRVNCTGLPLDNYLRIGFSYPENLTSADLAKIRQIYQERSELRFQQLSNGRIYDLWSDEIKRTIELLDQLGLDSSDLKKKFKDISRSESLFYLAQLAKASQSALAEVDETELARTRQRIFRQKHLPAQLSADFQGSLRPYQQAGFTWLSQLFSAQLGGVLADDMGLGKTVQLIGLIQAMQAKYPASQSLIVVPTSLVANWQDEISRFAPQLKAVAVTGQRQQRWQILAAGAHQIYITSYGLVQNDLELLKEKDFALLVLDEAQRVKNFASKTATAIRKIKAGCRFALTGTPIENNLLDLWSLFSVIVPDYLGSLRKFKETFMNGRPDLALLRDKISPFILRRLKQDVLADLPEKTETILKVDMSREQKKLYLAYHDQTLRLLKENKQKLMTVLTQLTRLRQICSHPAMFLPDYKADSGKMEVLLQLVTDLKAEQRRALVFSQFTSLLDLIGQEFEQADIDYVRLDGSTAAKARPQLIKEFNQGEQTVFLISLKAGGVGLNLTAADTVIHCDPWWNPSVEEQASARVYRIGQNKRVQIIHLIARGSIEEAVNEVKQQKRELIDQLIQPTDSNIKGLSAEQIQELLLWQSDELA